MELSRDQILNYRDIVSYREEYLSLREEAQRVHAGLKASEFAKLCRRELESQDMAATPTNWVVAAEAVVSDLLASEIEEEQYLLARRDEIALDGGF